MRWWLALVALLASPLARAEDSRLRMDFAVSPFTAAPEPLTLCAGVFPITALELDACGAWASTHLALTSHAFLRTRLVNSTSFELAAGAGAGARVMRTCGAFACAYSAGPEALLSVEATKWINERVGIGAQLDGGVSLQWLEAARGVWRQSWLLPVRGMLSVSVGW